MKARRNGCVSEEEDAVVGATEEGWEMMSEKPLFKKDPGCQSL